MSISASRNARPNFCWTFCASATARRLYLVGDLIDFWSLRKGGRWPAAHGEVLKTILAKARAGTRVIYVPGNHDEVARDYLGLRVGDIEIAPEAIHVTADGRRFLVTHGDECDSAVRCGGPLLQRAGRRGLRPAAVPEPLVQPLAATLEPSLLVAGQFPQAAHRSGRRLHRALRGGGGARGGAARAGRRDLRAHPPRRPARSQRRAVLQRRRLGGKLHRAGGASRRGAGNPALEPPTGGGGGTGTAPLAGDAAGSGWAATGL
ncbi:MAG: hypothetical protein M0C28_24680 [Candidatus Moduliflexus flocculans]|nr:hypothetical protein [Candidatus Moduliflexus flocculans]